MIHVNSKAYKLHYQNFTNLAIFFKSLLITPEDTNFINGRTRLENLIKYWFLNLQHVLNNRLKGLRGY